VKIKPTNAYKHLNLVNLLHVSVSATSVTILREMSLEGYITKNNSQNQCTDVKYYILKYMV